MTRFFADLDRTLVYSNDALHAGALDSPTPTLVCVEMYLNEPASWVTARAAEGITRLLEAQVLIPVSTRSVEQYRRIELPGRVPNLALAANGGRLLVNGHVDEDYSRTTASSLEASTPAEDVVAHLIAVSDERFCIKLRSVEDLFCYAVVEVGHVPTNWIRDLAGYATSVGWTLSDQGRKIYLLPNVLTKGEGVRRVAAHLELEWFIAAGDTSTDESMLSLADLALIPKHGSLADTATTLRIPVTHRTGVMCGQELVEWAERHLLADRTGNRRSAAT